MPMAAKGASGEGKITVSFYLERQSLQLSPAARSQGRMQWSSSSKNHFERRTFFPTAVTAPFTTFVLEIGG